MAPEPLSPSQLKDALTELPSWSVRDDHLERSYTFEGHLAAVAALTQIARVQESLGHHADLTLSYDKLSVSVNTHSVGGKVTELDTELAHRIEQIAVEHGVA
ncbi:4a-hydroxytetrahydrobiopterin dehydratase [Streptomyces sp. TP-A0874]|uniref:4a-hydroxytetrahydrobiopterin dehydratase n=1 Tax=Streptomyces sp. TP-A0874 TaxID=549819 RepID=UPI00085369C0|nr:4a-hydroxytetrahydrobiopterin dehydratase [Streptomyces sp. TP-A0874]